MKLLRWRNIVKNQETFDTLRFSFPKQAKGVGCMYFGKMVYFFMRKARSF